MKNPFHYFLMSPEATPSAGGGAPPASSTAGALGATPPPATGTPPPAGGATPPATGAPPPAAPSTEWLSGIKDAGLKDYVTTAKGFQSVEMMADAYRNLEKLVGAPKERLLTLPENFRDDKGQLTPEAREIFSRLGAPKESKDYGLKLAEGGDQRRLDGFLKAAHELGLNTWQVEALNKMDSEYMGAMKTEMQAQQVEKFKADDATLRREWGAAYEQEFNFAKEGMKKMGLTNQDVDMLSGAKGHAWTVKLLNAMGKATGEASYVSGQRPDRANTPATAEAKIKELTNTPGFWDRLEKGDLEARRMWNKYNEEAAAGQMIPG